MEPEKSNFKKIIEIIGFQNVADFTNQMGSEGQKLIPATMEDDNKLASMLKFISEIKINDSTPNSNKQLTLSDIDRNLIKLLTDLPDDVDNNSIKLLLNELRLLQLNIILGNCQKIRDELRIVKEAIQKISDESTKTLEQNKQLQQQNNQLQQENNENAKKVAAATEFINNLINALTNKTRILSELNRHANVPEIQVGGNNHYYKYRKYLHKFMNLRDK